MTHHLSKEEHDKITPYANMLDALLDGMIDLTAEGVEKAARLLTAYQEKMKKYFGNWHFVFTGNFESSDLTLFRSMPIDSGKPRSE